MPVPAPRSTDATSITRNSLGPTHSATVWRTLSFRSTILDYLQQFDLLTWQVSNLTLLPKLKTPFRFPSPAPRSFVHSSINVSGFGCRFTLTVEYKHSIVVKTWDNVSEMIERIVIDGYRRFQRLDLSPIPGLNIVVGDNESGKSTLLEAVSLAFTGRVNGNWASEELNPYWFHQGRVKRFFEDLRAGGATSPPEILIEIYLGEDDEPQRMRGVHNSIGADCPGVSVSIAPSDDFAEEFRLYLADTPPSILPVEFYGIEWRDFADNPLHQRPRELAVSYIDARTIRSTSGVDYHTRAMLTDYLDGKERATISLAHRRSRQLITDETLKGINERIAADESFLHDRSVGLQMDQSSRTSWETGIVPQVDGIPFAMSGQGQQAAMKVALAMSRRHETAFVLIEEPENHLSHTNLTRLLSRIQMLAGDRQQLFVTTHSSFVLNRLGLDRLHLLHDGRTARLTGLDESTVKYFRKLSGYDTLRLVLATKLALVEGPSDAIVLERAYLDATGTHPTDVGIDIVAMGGLTFGRALELCQRLDRSVVVLQDNDGRAPDEVRESVKDFLERGKRELLVSDQSSGTTLEPQLIAINDESLLRKVLGVASNADLNTWMTNNKTESALRILDSPDSIAYPDYISEAIELLK